MEEKLKIMVVDDERIIRESFLHWFENHGHVVRTASSGLEALDQMQKTAFDLVFADVKMPGMDGIELLERILADYPETLVVIITAYGSIESAVKAIKIGAVDYLLKPFKPEQLSLVVEKAAAQKRMVLEHRCMRERLEEMIRFENIVGQSDAMKIVFALIQQVAQSDAAVLLVGETGTGKELVARAIHAKSRRSRLPFIAINCGAIPDALLESELFGHQKGAFTGADHPRKGFFEIVSGGTLFLDEIGEVSARMQVDLLRVLQEKKIVKIGDRALVDVDFRLISATSKELYQEVEKGGFREDLFYRINVITLPIPPLRERKSDIPILVEHFLSKYSHQTTKRVDHVTREAMELLKEYAWPGNVREMQNAIERAVVLSKKRMLGVDDFSFLHPGAKPELKAMSLRDRERAYVYEILQQCEWNITRASRILDVNRSTLHQMIKRYSLSRP